MSNIKPRLLVAISIFHLRNIVTNENVKIYK